MKQKILEIFKQLLILLCASFTATYLIFLITLAFAPCAPNMRGLHCLFKFSKALDTTLGGHILASVGLILVYFPWSLHAWKKEVRNLKPFLLAGTLIAGINGIAIGLFFSDSHLYSFALILLPFALCGLFTVLLHWVILILLEQRNLLLNNTMEIT